jgi:hypothetical protein
MRRLPHQGARHSTVDHGDASNSVFLLLHLWVLPSRWAILLRRSPSSLSCLWMASQCEWLSLLRRCLQDFRVEDPSGTRKGGPNRPPECRWPGSVAPLPRGSSGDYALCPFHLHDYDDVILASKMEVLRA